MAIQLQGNGGTVAEVDGTVWRAQRVTDRPTEFGAGGYYIATVSGATATAVAAAANLVSFRWTSATMLCLIRELEIQMQVTIASSSVIPQLAAYIARGFTVADSAGTAVTLGTGNKKRTSMASSVLGDFRFANAGVLTAGTRTVDANSILNVNVPIALGSNLVKGFNIDGPGDHPIVLAQNEGIVLQNVATLTTAGAYQFTVRFGWAEVPAY